jgi:hypothetical protein
MKRIICCGIAVLLSLFVLAQNEQDVLRYSRIGFGGIARFMSTGGAFGALGGDISCMSVNPAGLGVFRKSEFTFTPSFYNMNVHSGFADTSSSDERFNMKVDQVGFVVATKPETRTDHGWQMLSMAVNFSRTNSFQANLLMVGNSRSSLLDSWARSAAGTGFSSLDAFNEDLAWQTYLLDPYMDTSHYVDRVPDGDLIKHFKQVEIRGGMGEWTFGGAANYDNRIYIGASIGIPTVKYEETDLYTEEEVYDTVSNFDYMKFEQYLETKGRGINFKAGVIFRPVDWMRIGLAFSSPTNLKLNDTYFSKMTSILGDTVRSYDSPDGSYRYTIRTPMRVTGSVAFVVYKFALLTADYEFVDYSDGKLKSQDYNFFDENQQVKAKYKSASNIRAGIELKFVPFSVRAGMGYYGSPYNPAVNNEASRLYICGGVGYRDPDDVFFIDLGFVSQRFTENYYFYDQSLVEPVVNKWKSVNVLLTAGFRFGDEPVTE